MPISRTQNADAPTRIASSATRAEKAESWRMRSGYPQRRGDPNANASDHNSGGNGINAIARPPLAGS